jgi:catechol 2,3-dioxygenase
MSSNTDARTTAELTGGLFEARRLTHFNIQVQDVNECVDFYRDVVGFNVAYERPLINAVFFSNQSTYHDLAVMDAHGPLGTGHETVLHHLAFELENEVELVASYQRAVAAGVTFTTTQSHDVAHSVYLDDPDGNGVEIYADVIAAWQEVSTGVITAAKQDWQPGDTTPIAEACYPVNPSISYVEGAVFRPTKTVSACLVARQYAKMLDFYTGVVGLRPVVEGQGFAVLAGSVGEPTLSLVEAGSGRQPGLHHVTVELPTTDELERGAEALRQQGISASPPGEAPVLGAVYLTDPNGLLVKLAAAGSTDMAGLASLSAQEALYVL